MYSQFMMHGQKNIKLFLRVQLVTRNKQTPSRLRKL